MALESANDNLAMAFQRSPPTGPGCKSGPGAPCETRGPERIGRRTHLRPRRTQRQPCFRAAQGYMGHRSAGTGQDRTGSNEAEDHAAVRPQLSFQEGRGAHQAAQWSLGERVAQRPGNARPGPGQRQGDSLETWLGSQERREDCLSPGIYRTRRRATSPFQRCSCACWRLRSDPGAAESSALSAGATMDREVVWPETQEKEDPDPLHLHSRPIPPVGACELGEFLWNDWCS